MKFLRLIYLCYTKKVNIKFQFKKMCTKQVPLKVSVLLGYSTVSVGDLCRTRRDCAGLVSKGQSVHTVLKCQASYARTGCNCTTILSTKNLHIAGKLHVRMWGYKFLEHCPPLHSCSRDDCVATV